MRARTLLGGALLVSAALFASPARAQSAPDGSIDPPGVAVQHVAQAASPTHGSGPKAEERWWEDPPVQERDKTARITLTAVGGGLAGLGALAMLGAGITWLVAAGESTVLDDECPNKICYEDSRGGEALERARDAERGAGIVFGIGFPVMTAGFVMMLFGAGLSDKRTGVAVLPAVDAEGGGLIVEAKF